MKKLIIVVLAVLLLGIVIGCKKDESSSGSNATASSGSTDSTQATSPTPVEIVYWSMWNSTEPQAMAIKEGIDEFMKLNPGVKIKITWAGREIRKTLQPALDNGQAIDLWDEDLQRIVVNWGKYALALDNYVTKSYPGTEGKSYKDAVMGNLIDLGASFSNDGKLYGIPYQPFLFAFMYNKEHFKEAGISSTPKTWDEFLTACAKLKAAGYTPLTTDDAYAETLLGHHLARYKGVEWVESLVSDPTNAMWDDPAVYETLMAYKNLRDMGYLSDNVEGNKWPAGQQDLALGDVSMYLNGTWLVNEVMGTTGPDFPWGTFSYPAVPGGVDGISAANFGSQGFQVNKDTKNPEEVFKLIVHLTTGKWDSEIAKRSFGVPVSGTAEWPVQLVDAKEVFQNLDTHYPWAAGIQNNPDKLPLIKESFIKLMGGSITPEQFISNMK